MAYKPVYKPGTTHLLFRFDPERDIIEIQDRNVKTYVDLAQYRAPESAKEIAGERQDIRLHGD